MQGKEMASVYVYLCPLLYASRTAQLCVIEPNTGDSPIAKAACGFRGFSRVTNGYGVQYGNISEVLDNH